MDRGGERAVRSPPHERASCCCSSKVDGESPTASCVARVRSARHPGGDARAAASGASGGSHRVSFVCAL